MDAVGEPAGGEDAAGVAHADIAAAARHVAVAADGHGQGIAAVIAARPGAAADTAAAAHALGKHAVGVGACRGDPAGIRDVHQAAGATAAAGAADTHRP